MLAGLAVSALAGCGNTTEDGTPRRTAREVTETLDRFALAELSHAPERATRLGVTEAELGFAFEHRLSDRSQAGFERHRLVLLDRLEQLDATPLPPDTSALRSHLRAVHAGHLRAAEVAGFGHGQADLFDARPYVVDHRAGTLIEAISVLMLDQSLSRPEDAASFLARLSAIAPEMENERRRLLADADAGIRPPKAVLHRLEAVAADLTSGPPETHALVRLYETALAGIDALPPAARERLAGDVRREVAERLYPAVGELRATANALAILAPETPGVWALPEGDAYYDAVLAYHASQPVEAEDLVPALDAEAAAIGTVLDDLLTGLEPVTGTQTPATIGPDAVQADTPAPPPLADRIAAALARIEVQSGAPPGRPALADASGVPAPGPGALLAAKAQAMLPDLLRWAERQTARPPQTGLAVIAVPPSLRRAMGAATYQPPALDGSAPGLLYLNPDPPHDWPSHRISSVLAAQAFPGRHMQAAIALERSGAPVIRGVIAETAFIEGWALYAAKLSRDRLAPQENPAAYIGALQSELLGVTLARADIGVHRMRWTRDEAIDYLQDTAAISPELAALLVDDISAAPGQAPAAIIGRNVFLSLRERAEIVLQDRFDVPSFHHAALSLGARPLDMLEADLERWYEAQL